jgi:hypothetical protein
VGEKSSACSVRVGKPAGQKRTGRPKPKSRWKVKSFVKKEGWKVLDPFIYIRIGKSGWLL